MKIHIILIFSSGSFSTLVLGCNDPFNKKITAFPLYFVVLSLYAQLILAEGFVSLILNIIFSFSSGSFSTLVLGCNDPFDKKISAFPLYFVVLSFYAAEN